MMFEARVFIIMFPDSTCRPAIAGAKVPHACLWFLERAGLRIARFVLHSSLSMRILPPQARGCCPEIGESFAFFAKPPGIEGGVIFDRRSARRRGRAASRSPSSPREERGGRAGVRGKQRPKHPYAYELPSAF